MSPFKYYVEVYFAYSLILPFPDILDEFLPAQIVASQTPLSHQLFLHHHLGGDAGVVTARVPQGGLPTHPVPVDRKIKPTNSAHTFVFCE